MASPVPPPQDDRPAPRAGLLERAAKYHKEIGYGLFVLAALFAIAPVWLLVQYGWPKAAGPLLVWGVLTTLASLAAGLVSVLMRPDAGLSEVQKVRLVLLFLGATLGLLTALLGLLLPFFAPYSTIFFGGMTEWRKNAMPILGTAAAVVGGLALTFASLQLGRGQERNSALMRRLLYGYNAVFSSLLLAAILLLVNLLPYIPQLGPYDYLHRFFATTFDWTEARIYSISPRTKNTLTDLQDPVKVYVLMDSADPLTEQTMTLLQNLHGVNPRLTYEEISSLSIDRIRQLLQDYKDKISIDPGGGLVRGVLVVYGEKPKENVQFIREQELFAEQRDEDDPTSQRVLFQGEGVLMKAIRSLKGKKPVVYFTQGDEEINFNEAREDSTDGMGVMVRTMQKNEVYDLKELHLAGPGAATAVPDDADVVVVARPETMKPPALKALAAYMGCNYDETTKSFVEAPKGRKGKLIVLLDVETQDSPPRMIQSGLEPLLQRFGVVVGDDRILTLENPGRPTELSVEADRNSPNAVAKAFLDPNREIFHFNDVRTVRQAPGPGGPFTFEGLLTTASDPVWATTDLRKPTDLARAKSEEGAAAKFSDGPLTVAAAVSEPKAPNMPEDFTHANIPKGGSPRLVVFGDAGWVTNQGLLGYPDGEAKYALFTSCVSWLREQSDIGATPVEADETKSRIPYRANVSNDAAFNMQFLPLGHLILAVVAGGIGIWLVRRR